MAMKNLKRKLKEKAKEKSKTTPSNKSKAAKAGKTKITKKGSLQKAKRKIDDFLLKVGPSVSAQVQKLSDKIENSVIKVEDVKNVGLQVLKRARAFSENIKKGRKKGSA